MGGWTLRFQCFKEEASCWDFEESNGYNGESNGGQW